MTLSLIILTRNEINGVRAIIPKIPRQAVDEIIVMDGNSTDGTVEYLQSQGLQVVQQRAPGRGSAMREGVERATGDVVLFFSPDGNEDPADIARFRPLLEQGNGLVIASRMMKGAWNEEDASWFRLRKWANQAFTLLAGLCWNRTGVFVTDTINGFRAIRKDVLERLQLDAKGYTIEFQMTMRCWRLGIPVAEFPTHEGARIGGESGAKAIPTGLAFLRCLWNERRWNGDVVVREERERSAPPRPWTLWTWTWLPAILAVVIGLVMLGARRGLLTPDEGLFLFVRDAWRAIILALANMPIHGWAEASAALQTKLEGSFYVGFNARPLYVLLTTLSSLVWGSWMSLALPSAIAVGAFLWAISRAPWSLGIRIWITLLALSSPIVLFFGSAGLAQASAGIVLFYGVMVATSTRFTETRRMVLGGVLLGMAGLAHYSAFPLVGLIVIAVGVCTMALKQWLRRMSLFAAGIAMPLILTEGATRLIRMGWDQVHPAAGFGTYFSEVFGIFFIVEHTNEWFPWAYYFTTLWRAEGVIWVALAMTAFVCIAFLWKHVPVSIRVSTIVCIGGVALLSATSFKGVRALMLILPLMLWIIGWFLNEISRGFGRKTVAITLILLAMGLGIQRIPRVVDLATMPHVMEQIPALIAAQEGLDHPPEVRAAQAQWMAQRTIAHGATYPLEAWLTGVMRVTNGPVVAVVESVEDFPTFASRMDAACARDGGRMGSLPWSTLSAYDWHNRQFGRGTDGNTVRYCLISVRAR